MATEGTHPPGALWLLRRKPMWTAQCQACGKDLLEDDENVGWLQPEGVEHALDGLDFCPRCNAPITELGQELRADAEADERGELQ